MATRVTKNKQKEASAARAAPLYFLFLFGKHKLSLPCWEGDEPPVRRQKVLL